ncbi:MAG: UpxY family transcription antiterminator [Acidobacteriia bacterium]|nr:UpxY family transcription antiterminator [Terriglobia bacterium]
MTTDLNAPVVLNSYQNRQWYALYTCAQHEKRVFEELKRRAVESFLPLYESVRRWKDRQVRLELPLFQGYVFVQISLRDKLHALEVPGVVRLVGFGGVPASLPDEQVDAMRASMTGLLRAEPHAYLTAGRRVRVRSGPLRGLEGILVRRKSAFRLVVSVELIMRSVSLEVDASDVEPLWPRSGVCTQEQITLQRV